MKNTLMNFEPCCETCEYCVTDEDKLFCENMNADEWFEEVSADHRCPLWEEKDD